MRHFLRACWRSTYPIRRPISAKAEGFVRLCVTRALACHNPTAELAKDVSLALDALIAEHDRLHRRVESLQRSIERLERSNHAALIGDGQAAD